MKCLERWWLWQRPLGVHDKLPLLQSISAGQLLMDESPENCRWHLENCSFHDQNVITGHASCWISEADRGWNGAYLGSGIWELHDKQNQIGASLSLHLPLSVPLVFQWSPNPLLSTFFHPCVCVCVCVTLSRVHSVPLPAFSLRFGDSNVKTHQLYPEQSRFQCHQALPPGSVNANGKSLTEAADTLFFP